MIKAAYARHRLNFKVPSRTSREVLTYKDVWYIRLTDTSSGKSGIGECAVFPGLSCDWREDYESLIVKTCRSLTKGETPDIADFPSIKFGVESAVRQLSDTQSSWHRGESSIVINGLVWMGSEEEMINRVAEKLSQGFRCIKLKIGGIDFLREIEILKAIRAEYPAEMIELRLDANGAFSPQNALEKLEMLARYDIHSIEQPIKQGQWKIMGETCKNSPIPIALDEELIGINDTSKKSEMLDAVKPQYIILKPTLCGGFSGSDEWIALAQERGINWWATSALESNVGLDAIADWVCGYKPTMPQGLGTGALYTNNIPSPLTLAGENLGYASQPTWDYSQLNWIEV